MSAMRNSNVLINTSKLDSELLRTFLAVAETGSFSKAACRIFRSQSAVSLQIKQLENLLGQAVFQRHARGVELTSTGEKLRLTAQNVVNLLDKCFGELKTNPLQGSIRVGIPDEFGESFLAEVIAQFARNYPQVDLAVRCSFSADFPAALAADEIDLAVFAVEQPADDMLVLRTEKTYWVTSKNHLVHEQDPLPVALFDRACWWRDRALEALETAARPYQVVFTSESVMGITAAISAGIAVGLLGESALRDNFRILSSRQGLPEIPDSALVLKCREGVSKSVSLAMSNAIIEAFGKS
jgi:DNA-binding transcriptional LysR family regulator